MNLNSLIIVYAVVLMISVSFASYLWYSYRDELLKWTCLLWVTVIFGFLAQGVFDNLQLSGFLAYSVNIFTVWILLLLTNKTSNTQIPIKLLLRSTALALLISVVLFLFGFSYTISSLPFSLACSVSLMYGAFRVSNKNSPPTNSYRLLLAFTALHYLDYPFLRPDPQMALVGFSMGLVFTFCYSIIIPLFVMRKISETHLKELEDKVTNRTLELKNTNLALAEANAVLQEVLQENRTLLSVMIHDLNNPINIIAGSAKNLGTLKIEDKSKRWINMIEKSATTLAQTISHVSTFHSARYGKITPAQPVEVNFNSIVIELRNDFAEPLTKKSIHLETRIEFLGNVVVVTEVDRLRNQVLANLISNAIKFSHPGNKIEMIISKSESNVIITVKDFGVGIPAKLTSGIFDSRKMASTYGTFGEKGMGLGLSIVHHYVKSMGGTVRLQNDTECLQGTCFEVILRQTLT